MNRHERRTAAERAKSSLILPRAPRAAHEIVRNVACQMAAEVYEASAHDNRFYGCFPKLQGFVDATWEQFLPQAREVLVDMLVNDDAVPQSQKDDIEAALLLDRGILQAAERGSIFAPGEIPISGRMQ